MDIREIANLMEDVPNEDMHSGGISEIILRPLADTELMADSWSFDIERLAHGIEAAEAGLENRHIIVGAWARTGALVVAGRGDPGVYDHFTNEGNQLRQRWATAPGIREIIPNTNRRKYTRYRELRRILTKWEAEQHEKELATSMQNIEPADMNIDLFNVDRFGSVHNRGGQHDRLDNPLFHAWVRENLSELDYDMVTNKRKYKSIPDKFIIRDYFKEFITMNPGNVIEIIPLEHRRSS